MFNLRVDRHDTALGFTTDWINELAKHFDHVTVITMYRGTEAVADNVEVMSAGLERGWSKPRRVLRFYRLLFTALGSRRYDCCFAHMMPLFLLLAGPILRMKGIPAVLWYAHNHRSRILPFATAFADLAVASTKTAFPLETPKLRVVGQGIDTEKFKPSSHSSKPDYLRMMTVGRISPVKDIALMLRAVQALALARPHLATEFWIVGEPLTERDRTYLERCRELAGSLGIADRVRWLDPVPFDRVHEAYSKADVFLSANDNGLDKAILEAMASGLPVIAMHPAISSPLGQFYASDEGEFRKALLRVCDFEQTARKELGLRLRAYVEREHGLPQLGGRIAGLLKGLVP
jgi:glycosyltransferase involved in cell wall biosynthesis